MKARAADDDEEEEEGEEEGGSEEEEREGAPDGLHRGAQGRNGAVSAFGTAQQSSTGQGSKSRQSMKSLEVVIGSLLSDQSLPTPLSYPPAPDAAAELSTASFDDCVR